MIHTMSNFWKTIRKAPFSAKLGMTIIIANVLVAVFAPVISPYGQNEIVGSEFQKWSSEHWLGTDSLGRDMVARMSFGARNSISLALITASFAFLLGSTFALLAVALGGWVDQVLSWFVDMVLSIPTIIFALLALSILGTNITTLVGVMALIYAAPVYRVTRAIARNVVVLDFVEVARLRGEGIWWIIRREILPNAMPLLIAEFGLRFCFIFLMISALSFLGLGIQPPMPDWGSMVRENATLITYGDITPLLPAAAIAILTVGVNFVVDWFLYKTAGLRDGR